MKTAAVIQIWGVFAFAGCFLSAPVITQTLTDATPLWRRAHENSIGSIAGNETGLANSRSCEGRGRHSGIHCQAEQQGILSCSGQTRVTARRRNQHSAAGKVWG